MDDNGAVQKGSRQARGREAWIWCPSGSFVASSVNSPRNGAPANVIAPFVTPIIVSASVKTASITVRTAARRVTIRRGIGP